MKDLFQFVKRWQVLERDRKDLDFRKTQFARDLYAEFNTDHDFRDWCETKLGLRSSQVEELLTRALAAGVANDAKTYKEVGGFKALQPLIGRDKSAQTRVLQSAKTQGRPILSVMKEMGLIKAPPPSTMLTDIESLSRFVLDSNAPEHLKTIARKYISAATGRAA